MEKHYDVGIYGWWCHENFGGCLTYFALERTIKKLGYSTLMIQEALGYPARYTIPQDCISMQFAKEVYDYAPQTTAADLVRFNDICDKFIVGGDQLWNESIPFSREDCFLNFVHADKLKLSYSTSFGQKDHNPTATFLNKMSPLLRRFDAISVREKYAESIAASMYNAQAKHVIDAVFLLDKADYLDVTKHADFVPNGKYLLAFILNPSVTKRAQIEAIANKLRLKVLCIPDAAAAYHESFYKIFAGLDILSPLSVPNFIKAYANADYIVTDSFHGTCMSYVFEKDFNVYFNEQRGADRFVDLMNILDLNSRRISENDRIEDIPFNKNINPNVDWTTAKKNVSAEKERGLSWLKNALALQPAATAAPSAIANPEVDRLLNNSDFKKIRMLVSLLNDYGVQHVVLSPGGRDVPIIRMFEHNERTFVLHRVTDERSAAYFGMGLATQLQQPVACVCTSGTAASNYLPAVTEAYYTGIPLIMITADRYGVYLNHGEDQTIPQKSIYSGVVKKEISLPDYSNWFAEYQTRRDVSECILEATHNGDGPVHINVPVDNITIGAKVPKCYWQVLPFTYPHIMRVGFVNGDAEMRKWLDALLRSQRIMLVYGQNHPLTERQKHYVDLFASRFNCVILTDHISNFNNKYCVQSFNMLNNIDQETFNAELAPDILITVGGKRLMNDPLTFKVRNCNKGIRHWSVTPDGRVKDFYFKLTSVIESSQDYFFEWFAENATDHVNNENYLNSWRNLFNRHNSYRPIEGFNAHYVQKKLCELIPANSVLHLGVGQSFFDIRRYHLDSSISVFCNMGTNGIDGCTSTFMGQCAIERTKCCVLLVGDLSFFYDMNSIWNKNVGANARIIMVNNNGTDLLRSHNLKAVSSVHNTLAEGWVKSNHNFEYVSARTPKEYDEKIEYVLSNKPSKAVFFEVICD